MNISARSCKRNKPLKIKHTETRVPLLSFIKTWTRTVSWRQHQTPRVMRTTEASEVRLEKASAESCAKTDVESFTKVSSSPSTVHQKHAVRTQVEHARERKNKHVFISHGETLHESFSRPVNHWIQKITQIQLIQFTVSQHSLWNEALNNLNFVSHDSLHIMMAWWEIQSSKCEICIDISYLKTHTHTHHRPILKQNNAMLRNVFLLSFLGQNHEIITASASRF